MVKDSRQLTSSITRQREVINAEDFIVSESDIRVDTLKYLKWTLTWVLACLPAAVVAHVFGWLVLAAVPGTMVTAWASVVATLTGAMTWIAIGSRPTKGRKLPYR